VSELCVRCVFLCECGCGGLCFNCVCVCVCVCVIERRETDRQRLGVWIC